MVMEDGMKTGGNRSKTLTAGNATPSEVHHGPSTVAVGQAIKPVQGK